MTLRLARFGTAAACAWLTFAGSMPGGTAHAAPAAPAAASGAASGAAAGAAPGDVAPIDTLKRIRDTATITLGVRESSGAVLVRRRAAGAAGLFDRPLHARRGCREGRTEAAEARRALRRRDAGEPGRDAGGRKDRPRMRLDDQHAKARRGCRFRLHDVRLGCAPARAQGVEGDQHRRPARQDRRGRPRHDPPRSCFGR